MQTVHTVADLRRILDGWRSTGDTVALVPTMGALHDGHLALVEAAKRNAERVVASIFVNPRQFGPTEDFDRYPRDPDRDAALLERAGVDLLHAPDAGAVYPDGFATTVSLAGPALGMEADHREGFFEGVATVVAKLLLRTGADRVVFGEKDYQQLVVIRRMVADLDIRTRVIPVPVAREADGLALSSRNAYLDDGDRRRASGLYHVLCETAAMLRDGATPGWALNEGREALASAFDRVDYLELRDADTLAPVNTPFREARLLAAVRLKTTRLIDCVPVVIDG